MTFSMIDITSTQLQGLRTLCSDCITRKEICESEVSYSCRVITISGGGGGSGGGGSDGGGGGSCGGGGGGGGRYALSWEATVLSKVLDRLDRLDIGG